jgi:hypothetical protein
MLINRLTEVGHRLERIKNALDALDQYAKEQIEHPTNPFTPSPTRPYSMTKRIRT